MLQWWLKRYGESFECVTELSCFPALTLTLTLTLPAETMRWPSFGLNFGVLIILFALFVEIIEVHFFFREYNVYIIEWVPTKGEILITS